MSRADKVIEVAMAEVGYLEKSKIAYQKNPQILYEKTAGAGKDNYTKYGKEMKDLYPKTMDFPAPWCDSWCDWCFQKAYGVSNAKKLLGEFDDYTVNSATLYKKKGALDDNPRKGDQVFFTKNGKISGCYHTGLVYKVDENYFYTIEGNTSSTETVVANGGCVAKKKYLRTKYKGKVLFGHPKYEVEDDLTSIARACMRGEYGVGAVRRAKLIEEGYNPAMVQARINELYAEKQKPIDDVPKYIWNFLMDYIKNPYGVAGLMGNLKAESGLNPRNMQNSYEKKLGFTDDTYTVAVDSGAYGRFCVDKVGYGLAQWTSDGRKKALYNSRGKRSIGDLNMQLEFLIKELTTSYRGVFNGLKVAESVREASDLVLKKFECPKDQSVNVQVKRMLLGEEIYSKYTK